MSTRNFFSRSIWALISASTTPHSNQFVNTASGAKFRVGDGVQGCTSSIHASPAFIVEGQTVVLLDTPGFDDTTSTGSAEILSMVSIYLAER